MIQKILSAVKVLLIELGFRERFGFEDLQFEGF